MKKMLCVVLVLCTLVSLAACGSKPQEAPASAGFQPALDTGTSCKITVVDLNDVLNCLCGRSDKDIIRCGLGICGVRLSHNSHYGIQDILLLDERSQFQRFPDGCNRVHIRRARLFFKNLCHVESAHAFPLGLDLDCVRPGLINHDEEGRVLMVPVFSRTYGMLVNNDLFEKEGISVPATWAELLAVCEAFRSKGYNSPMMGYSLKSSSCFMNTVAYPLFVATLADNPEALALANDLDPAAGEYMRPALEAVEQLIRNGCIDLEACDKIEDNYSQVILRFFEGDVPMMICTADTVSGTQKRESQSEAFSNAPFHYTFSPIPLTDDGGYFIDSPSVQFSVNKTCDDLDMTNEFMRFLITDSTLNEMASVKRLVTPTSDLSFDSVYAPFGQVPSDRIISPEVLGIKDPLTVQIRNAAFRVGTGEITVDEAIAMYGSFE